MRNESGQRMLRWAHLPECETPPDGWRVETFTNIATVIAGRSPPSETYNEKGVGLPFLQGNGDFSFVHPVPTLWCTAGARVAIKGDTLISVRAPVGEMNESRQPRLRHWPRSGRDPRHRVQHGLPSPRSSTVALASTESCTANPFRRRDGSPFRSTFGLPATRSSRASRHRRHPRRRRHGVGPHPRGGRADARVEACLFATVFL